MPGPLREHPGDRGLCDAHALALGHLAQRLHQVEVPVEVAALEAGAHAAEVARGQCAVAGEVAADQAAGQHPVRRDPYAELAGGRQDLGLDAAGDQRVLDLEVGDRGHGGGPAQGVRADLREPDVAHVPGFDGLGDGPDGLLDRHVRVHARDPVDVDVVPAEPLERVGQEVLDGLRPAVVTGEAALDRAQRAELDAGQRPLAGLGGRRAQRLVDQ